MTQRLRSALLLSVAIAFMFSLMGSSGCVGSGTPAAPLTDDQFAAQLQGDASSTVGLALTIALKEVPPETATRVTTDAKVIKDYITNIVMPAFNGASGAQVTSAAAQAVMSQFGNQVPASIKPFVLPILTLISQKIPLPADLTGGVDARTKKAISGVFAGVKEGIDTALAANAPAPAGAPPTARSAPITLRWATK